MWSAECGVLRLPVANNVERTHPQPPDPQSDWLSETTTGDLDIEDSWCIYSSSLMGDIPLWRYYYRTILYYRYRPILYYRITIDISLSIYIHVIHTQLLWFFSHPWRPRKPWSSWAPVQRYTDAAAWGNWSQRECMRCQRRLGGLGAEDTENFTMGHNEDDVNLPLLMIITLMNINVIDQYYYW